MLLLEVFLLDCVFNRTLSIFTVVDKVRLNIGSVAQHKISAFSVDVPEFGLKKMVSCKL